MWTLEIVLSTKTNDHHPNVKNILREELPELIEAALSRKGRQTNPPVGVLIGFTNNLDAPRVDVGIKIFGPNAKKSSRRRSAIEAELRKLLPERVSYEVHFVEMH